MLRTFSTEQLDQAAAKYLIQEEFNRNAIDYMLQGMIKAIQTSNKDLFPASQFYRGRMTVMLQRGWTKEEILALAQAFNLFFSYWAERGLRPYLFLQPIDLATNMEAFFKIEEAQLEVDQEIRKQRSKHIMKWRKKHPEVTARWSREYRARKKAKKEKEQQDAEANKPKLNDPEQQ